LRSKFGGGCYLVSYTKLNVNILSLIAAILIFFPLNYAADNISSWYINIKDDVKINQEIPKNEVQKAVNKTVSQEVQKPKGNVTNNNILIPEQTKVTDNKTVWQIEIPKFRFDSSN